MGNWGVGIYQNDIGDAVRFSYISKLKSGLDDNTALKDLITEYKNEIEDDDDKFDFWFALADVLHNYGRLTDEVKSNAIALLNNNDIERWNNNSDKKKRADILNNLSVKLNSAMPQYKKIAIHKPYVCYFNANEIYLYQMTSEFAISKGYENYWVSLYVEALTTKEFVVPGVMDTVPIVYLKIMKEKPSTIEDINKAPFVLLATAEKGTFKYYQRLLVTTSSHTFPKSKFEYFGKTNEFIYPDVNCITNDNLKGITGWKWFDERIIYGYELELKYLK